MLSGRAEHAFTRRAGPAEIAGDVHRSQQRIEITRGARPSVLPISAEDLDSMEATLELASHAAAMERVRRA